MRIRTVLGSDGEAELRLDRLSIDDVSLLESMFDFVASSDPNSTTFEERSIGSRVADRLGGLLAVMDDR